LETSWIHQQSRNSPNNQPEKEWSQGAKLSQLPLPTGYHPCKDGEKSAWKRLFMSRKLRNDTLNPTEN